MSRMSKNPVTWLQDIASLVPMIRAILKGQYKMPWKTAAWAALCLVYLLSPVDALPDMLPVLGFADDGAFVLFVLLLIHNDLQTFRQYRMQSKTVLEAEVINKGKNKHD